MDEGVLLLGFVALQRLAELIWAERNTRQLLAAAANLATRIIRCLLRSMPAGWSACSCSCAIIASIAPCWLCSSYCRWCGAGCSPR
jgi:hypothetical protein